MTLRIELYAPQLDLLLNAFDIKRLLLDRFETLLEEMKAMSAILDSKLSALTDAVAAETSVTQSAVTLIGGLASQLEAAIEDAKNSGATDEQLAALDGLSAKISASSAALSDAVTANTPAAPAPVGSDRVV